MPAIPVVEPERVAGRIQQRILRPPIVNPHIGVLGHTRSGKDYLVRRLILTAKPLARVVVLDVKRELTGDRTWDGWGADVRELPAQLETTGEQQVHYRVLCPPGDQARRTAERTIEYASMVGELILVLSDVGRVTEPRNRGGLALGGPVTRLMSEGASHGLSVIACSTSADWAESGVKDQTAAVFVGQTTTKPMRDKFAELAGLPRAARPALDTIRPWEFLYVDYADGEPALALTSARPPMPPGRF